MRRNFECVDGCIFAGEVSVRDIVEEYGTPLFLYDRGVMEKKVAHLRVVLGKHFTVYYSVKANPNQAIIRSFLKQGCGLEVASGGELFQALQAGGDPVRILFAGPGKSLEELDYAIRSGIGEIHVESLEEIGRIEEISRHLGSRSRVAVRINPSSESLGGAMQMGGKASPFGIDEECLGEVVTRLDRSDALDFSGVHLFTGTQILDHTVLLRQYARGLDIARKVACITGKPLGTVDFGGGFGIPYFQGEKELDIVAFGKGISPVIEEAKREPVFSGSTFIVEPGRYLVGESGIYITRVNSIKVSRGKKFLVVDGGLNHHLAASGNFGQVIKRNFPIVLLSRLGKELHETVDIVGPLCTPMDVLGRDVKLPRAKVGDLVGIFQSGAYARAASPLGFLSHPSPPEILAGEGKATLIRRRGVPGDYISDQMATSPLR
jgi:diaminopimelate decarboxylase